MPATLLTTKLHPPTLREGGVVRGRLLAALEDGAERRLTLLSAPAGYGKTVLLTHWFETTARDVAWLSLDEQDNEPRRFLRYLVAALQRADSTLQQADEAIAALDFSNSAAVLTFVLNDVAANDEALVLVLDDYHLITSEAVHEAVRFLLVHGPPPLRLVVGSRSDPPLGLARLRARRELCELRAEELRFREDEVQRLTASMQLELKHQDVALLTKRSEGWAAGLLLAALSLQGREEVSGFIETFTGTDRFVLDYLTEEVLTRQPAETQDFLVLSSVLKRLSGPLCDAVTGLTNSQARLEALERDNLFILPLDNRRGWYRYHAFFLDLLGYRLDQARPDLPRTLHGRAMRWFAANGSLGDALHHALSAEDFAAAAAMIDANAQAAAIRGALRAFAAPDGPRAEPPGDLEALLERAARAGLPADARAHLLERFEEGLTPAELPPPVRAEGLEPLSERELEVLRLVAAGLANKDIARRLGVSLNTVKTHSKNIHGKLGVSSRTQASARARALGLL